MKCKRCNKEMEIKIVRGEEIAVCQTCKVKRKNVRTTKPHSPEGEPKKSHNEVTRKTKAPRKSNNEVAQKAKTPRKTHNEVAQKAKTPKKPHNEVTQKIKTPKKPHNEVARNAKAPKKLNYKKAKICIGSFALLVGIVVVLLQFTSIFDNIRRRNESSAELAQAETVVQVGDSTLVKTDAFLIEGENFKAEYLRHEYTTDALGNYCVLIYYTYEVTKQGVASIPEQNVYMSVLGETEVAKRVTEGLDQPELENYSSEFSGGVGATMEVCVAFYCELDGRLELQVSDTSRRDMMQEQVLREN